MNLRHFRYKPGMLLLLLGGGAIAGACAALNVDYRQVAHGLLHAVGIRAGRANSQHPAEIIVTAGNELTIDGARQRLTAIAPDEVVRRLAWAAVPAQHGWLNFRGQSLESVVAELNLHNQRKLRVADPQTGRLLVAGRFRENDVDAFVAALAQTHGVKATRSAGADGQPEDVITLSGGNSSGSTAIQRAPKP